MARAWNAKGSVERGQRVHAKPKFGAQRTIFSSHVLIREEKNERKEVWTRETLLLFCRLVKGKSDVDELATVGHMKCVGAASKLDETLNCACLQWATFSSGKERDDVGRERR